MPIIGPIIAALGEAGAASGGASAASAAGAAAAQGLQAQAVGALEKKSQGLIGTIMKLAEGPMGVMDVVSNKLYDSLTQVPRVILDVEDKIVGVGKAWVDSLAAPIDTVKKLGDAVNRFVKLSSPMKVEIFTMKVDNAMATLGRRLEPITVMLGRAADRVGRTFAKLEPAIDSVIGPLEDIGDTFINHIEPAAKMAAPVLGFMGANLKVLALNLDLAQKGTEGLMMMMREFASNIPFVGELLNSFWDDTKKGILAVRDVQSNSVQESLRKMNQSALIGAFGGNDKKKRENPSDQFIRGIGEFVNKFKTVGDGIIGTFDDLNKGFRTRLDNFIGAFDKFVTRVDSLIPNLPRPGVAVSGVTAGVSAATTGNPKPVVDWLEDRWNNNKPW